MPNIAYDSEAWSYYPQHRWLFNKLELSLKLGYVAGPGGTSVPEDGDYIVRPIYNLSGMGVGAKRMQLTRGDYNSVPPGYFWCEYFHGPNITVDYEWDMVDDLRVLRPVFAAQGFRSSQDLYRFNAWKKIEPPFWRLPDFIKNLYDVPRINIEFIHDKIIEIHLRPGVDFPGESTQIIPVWSDMDESDFELYKKLGYKLFLNHDSADGHLDVFRLGFYYR